MTDISNFKKARVLVVGDVMVDRYLWGSANRISPEAPVPIVRLERETSRPGGAANVAANAASLGATVSLVGIVGADPNGTELLESLNQLGVHHPAFHISNSRRTTVKTRLIAQNQQVVRIDREDVTPSTAEEQTGVLELAAGLVDDVDAVILSDYGKGVLSTNVIGHVVGACEATGKPVLADPKGKHFNKYFGSTILTPNRREAAEACKLEESDPDLVIKAGETLIKELDLRSVLITQSESGMTLFQRDVSPKHFPASAREVFDVTGAGDSVIACLGVALAAGCSVEEAARLSNVAAGLSVQHIGAVAVSFDELDAELRRGSDEKPVR